jgi:hypothetical protein
MKNAILLHGTTNREEYFDDRFPSLSNSHWFPWLQKQLLIKGVFTQTPEMPDAYAPDYKKWKSEFEKLTVDKNSILVGHSCGGGFLLRWLSENKIQINKLILVAPWLDPDRERTKDFFEFNLDSGISNRASQVHMLYSTDDDSDVLKSVEIIKKEIANITIREYKNKGHFTLSDLKTEKFPELLELII